MAFLSCACSAAIAAILLRLKRGIIQFWVKKKNKTARMWRIYPLRVLKLYLK